MMRKPNAKPAMVRVICNSADASRDYSLLASRARQLYNEGKLVQIIADTSGWTYATRDGHRVH